MIKGISLIICCYNSANRITTTLAHVNSQKIPENLLWEIILVDNNSKDETINIAKQVWEETGNKTTITIVNETEQGLIFARKKGLSIAKYEYILFCDDDNWLAPDYVVNGFNILDKNPAIGIACGENTPVSDIELPAWFYNHAQSYAVGSPSLISKKMTKRGWIWGAGMLIRKSALEKIYKAGFTNYTSGRTGSNLSSGEDVEICKWMILSNYDLWFDTQLQLKHFIASNRLNKKYLIDLKKSNESTNTLFTIYDDFIAKKNKYKYIKNLLVIILKTPYKLLRNGFSLEEKLILYKLIEWLGFEPTIYPYKEIKHALKNLNKN